MSSWYDVFERYSVLEGRKFQNVPRGPEGCGLTDPGDWLQTCHTNRG